MESKIRIDLSNSHSIDFRGNNVEKHGNIFNFNLQGIPFEVTIDNMKDEYTLKIEGNEIDTKELPVMSEVEFKNFRNLFQYLSDNMKFSEMFVDFFGCYIDCIFTVNEQNLLIKSTRKVWLDTFSNLTEYTNETYGREISVIIHKIVYHWAHKMKDKFIIAS